MWDDWHPENTSVITVWDVSWLLSLLASDCYLCGMPPHCWAQTLIRTVCFLKFDWSLSGQQNGDIFQILQGEYGLPAPADMNQIVTQMVEFDSRNYLVSLDTAAKPSLTFLMALWNDLLYKKLFNLGKSLKHQDTLIIMHLLNLISS